MKRLNIFPKTFIYTIGIMSVLVILVHSLMYIMLPSFYLDIKREEVEIRADELMNGLKEISKFESKEMAEYFAIKYNLNITMIMEGKTYRYKGFTPANIYIETDKMDEIEIKDDEFSKDEIDSYRVIVEERELKNREGQEIRLFLALSIEPIDEAKEVVLKLFPYSVGISIIISLIAAYIYSSALTKPIKNILRVTKDMEELKKDSYCIIETEDEIGMIAENINSLYDTLWETINSLEERIDEISEVEREKIDFLRAASHELKTPLTSLHVLLENMKLNIGKYSDRDYYLDQAQDIVMESTEMVQSILNISKLNTMDDRDREEVNIRELLLDILENYIIIAKSKEIKIDLSLEEDCNLYINKNSMEKVLSNILSNAIRYTDDSKKIKIKLRDGKLSIENECVPLKEKELNNIFKAFYRPDFSRNKKDGGTGLGLYIIKDILESSKINYSFSPSELGMKFIIEFE